MKNSKECKDVLFYLNNVLIYEFPYKEITPKHLLLAILDSPSCHAYMMISQIIKQSLNLDIIFHQDYIVVNN